MPDRTETDILPYAEKSLALGKTLLASLISPTDRLPPPFNIFFTDCLLFEVLSALAKYPLLNTLSQFTSI